MERKKNSQESMIPKSDENHRIHEFSWHDEKQAGQEMRKSARSADLCQSEQSFL